MTSPLDQPIWSALTTRQRALSLGNDRLRLYPAAVAPFADARDSADLSDLASHIAAGDVAVLFTKEPVERPDGLTLLEATSGNQMVLQSLRAPGPAAGIVELDSEDVPAMRELVALTGPGPFGPRTIELGRFVGIRSGGRLVAMAGERMKPAGFTEISAVCTHPDHRGRGHSKALVADVARNILDQGDTPFLHVFSSNTDAIALYEQLGFKLRRTFHVTILRK
jgi:ribosomal protein S18 acetylase RimI-like enzyme